MKLYKRILAFLLALAMIGTMCPQTAYAAVGDETQVTTEQTEESEVPEETQADSEAAEEPEITDVMSVEEEEEVSQENTESVTEDVEQPEQTEEIKEQEEEEEVKEGSSEEKTVKEDETVVEETSETALQIPEDSVPSTGTVELEYNVLTSGEPLTGNTGSGNNYYYFKPEQSGIYYLTVESKEKRELSLGAYYKYFTTDTNGETTESDWYWTDGANYEQYGKKIEQILYLSSNEAYRFGVGDYSDEGSHNFDIKMSGPVEITGITATNPVNAAYDRLDFRGMQLSFQMSDGYTLVSDLESYQYSSNEDTQYISALNWFDIAYETAYYCDTYLRMDMIYKIDGAANTDISTLENGKHTAEASLKIYNEKEGTSDAKSFIFEFNVERNVIASIEVINQEQDTYHKDFNEYLESITLRVHYKDGRTPLELNSDTTGEIEQYLSYEDGDVTASTTTSIETYLDSGADFGKATVHVAYRGVETTYEITIEDNPYERMEVNPRRTIYYADCGYEFENSFNDGDWVSDSDVGSITLYYKDESKKPVTYESYYELPNNGNSTFGIVTESGDLIRDIDSYIEDYNGSVGKATARFTYCGLSADYEIEIQKKVIDHIEVLNPPTDNVYLANEYSSLKLDGLVIRAYEDETKYTDYDYSEYMSSTYDEDGNRILPEGLNEEDFIWFEKAFHTQLGGHNSIQYLEPGTYPVHVFLGGKEATFNIEVKESVISNLQISTKENASNMYLLNTDIEEQFNRYNLMISFTDESGEHEFTYGSDEYGEYRHKYNNSLNYSIPDITEAGEYQVTINWLGATATYTIQVVDKLIEDMRITSNPTRSIYYANADSSVRLSGLELEITELDGTVKEYRYDYWGDDEDSKYGDWDDIEYSDYYQINTSKVDWNTLGEYEVELSYKGCAVQIPITVAENPIASVEIIKAPNKTEYYQYETDCLELDLTGMEYQINYKDGSTPYIGKVEADEEEDDIVNSAYIPYNGYSYYLRYREMRDMDSDDSGYAVVGQNAAILTYMGVTIELPITVKQNPVKSIQCTKNPEKMSYIMCDYNVDLYGAEFLITYVDDTTKTVTVTTHTDEVAVDGDYAGKLSTRKGYTWEDGIREECLYVSYLNGRTKITLLPIDFTKETVTPIEDEGMQQVVLDGKTPYRIFAFTPKETKTYYFSSLGNYDSYGMLYNQNGRVIESDDDGDFKLSYSLEADRTYYYVATMYYYGSEGSYIFYLSSTNETFSFTNDMVETFEITSNPKDTWYEFDSSISGEYVDLDGLGYRITYTNGLEVTGTILHTNLSEDDTYEINGLPLTAHWKETSYDDEWDEMVVTQSDTNAIVIAYAGIQKEIPVKFNQPTPVESITVSKNPWTDKEIYQYNASDYMYNNKGLELVIHYNDGREDDTVIWTDDYDYEGNSIEGYYFDYHIKNDGFADGPIAGENAYVISYMGKTVEVPITIQQNPVKSIVVTKNPDKMAYFPEGESADLYGMQLQIVYIDGNTKLVDVTTHGSSFFVDDKYQESISGYLDWDDQQIWININYMWENTQVIVQRLKVTDLQAVPMVQEKTYFLSFKASGTYDSQCSYQVYSFVPDETAVYSFGGKLGYKQITGKWWGGYSRYKYLYNSEGTQLEYEYGDTPITRTLYKGSTYYYLVKCNVYGNRDVEGSCQVTKDTEAVPGEKTTIENVELNVISPVRGSSLPDANDIEDANEDVISGYYITKCTWSPSPEDDIARGGKAYRLMLVLKPYENYEFATNIAPTVNGKKVSSKSLSSNGSLTLYYTFPHTDCKVNIPTVDGYTLDTSMNEGEDGIVSYKGSYQFKYTKDANNNNNVNLIVKANDTVITPNDEGIYTITDITSDVTVVTKTDALQVESTSESKLSLYDKESLYDILVGKLNKSISENETENTLPVLESYQNDSDQFFFGWYTNQDENKNVTGSRFKSTTPITKNEYRLYAKWGKGIFSFKYNGLYANYKILSLDENNRMKLQLGDGKNPATETGLPASGGVPAVGAGENSGAIEIPSNMDLTDAEDLQALGIEGGTADIVAIGANAFADSSDLTSVTLPDTVEQIGAGAFSGCTNLTEVNLPESISKVESNTFSGCTNLTEVTIPQGVTTIGAGAFDGCTSLATVSIPDTVETIESDAFANTSGEGATNLTIVCSSTMAESEVVKQVAQDTGADVEKVDVTTDYPYDEKEFTYGEEALTITSGVTVNGEASDRVVTYSVTDGYEEYYDITSADGVITINPKKVSNKPYTLKLTSSGQSKELLISTEKCSLETADMDKISRFAVDAIPAVTYTGSTYKPEITVRDKQTQNVLRKGTDYEVTYSRNTNAGTAYVDIEGIGNYSGELSSSFVIEKAARTITANNMNITVGSNQKVDAKVTGDGALTYSSSNPSVAEINASTGVINAKSVGTATITITAPETANYKLATKQVGINVKKLAGTITTGAASYTKTYGDKAFSLEAKASGAAKLSYSSSNASVATVDANGNVTIKGAGTAVITVSSSATLLYEAASKSVSITVKKANKSISVSKTSVKKAYGDKAFSLGAKATGGERLTYSSNAKSVASVNSNGKVTIKGCGTATITIESAASKNYNAAKSKTVKITIAPKKASLSSVKSSKKAQMTVKWKKDSKASGYEISYSTNKKFKSAKRLNVGKNKTTSTTIKKLSKGKKYYVRIRSYKTVKGKKIYGAYSSAKNVTIKKK